jgi:hypothetical protein
LIAEWRSLFHDPKLPFYFVQLTAWKMPDEQPAGGGWGMIREMLGNCFLG